MPHDASRQEWVLAVDHGTSAMKVALIDMAGALLDWEARPLTLELVDGGGAVQDPDQWWSALVECSRTLLERNERVRARVRAVAVSSTYSTTVAIDAEGRAIGPALTWLDGRAASHVRRAMKGWVNLKGYGVDKLARWIPRAGGAPSLAGTDDLGHVLYWKHEQPDVYARAHAFVESKDYLNARLTGEIAASADSAALFWASDQRDVERVHYDAGLLRRLGLDADKLPPIRRATDMLGELLPLAAQALGLPAGVKVPVGAADLAAACVGSGAVRPYEGHLYVGTSSWILCHVPFKKTDLLHSIASLPAALEGQYFCANEQNVAGGAVAHLLEKLLPTLSYADMEQALQRSEPGAGGLIYTPWLNGELSPAADDSLRGGFFNMSLATDQDQLVRAVYEGVALNARWLLGHVEAFVGRKLESLRMIGGGARSDAWCQIYADILGRTIERVVDPIAANARGAALLAAIAMGRTTAADIPALVPIDRVFTPRRQHAALYDRHFETFVRLHEQQRRLKLRAA